MTTLILIKMLHHPSFPLLLFLLRFFLKGCWALVTKTSLFKDRVSPRGAKPSCGGRKSATGLLPGTSLLLTATPFSRRANRERANSTRTQWVLRKCWRLNCYLALEPHTYNFFPYIRGIGHWVLHALHSKRLLHLCTKISTHEMMWCLGLYSI